MPDQNTIDKVKTTVPLLKGPGGGIGHTVLPSFIYRVSRTTKRF